MYGPGKRSVAGSQQFLARAALGANLKGVFALAEDDTVLQPLQYPHAQVCGQAVFPRSNAQYADAAGKNASQIRDSGNGNKQACVACKIIGLQPCVFWWKTSAPVLLNISLPAGKAERASV